MIDQLATLRGQSAEKKHDTQVYDCIYREQSAEMKHDIYLLRAVY